MKHMCLKAASWSACRVWLGVRKIASPCLLSDQSCKCPGSQVHSVCVFSCNQWSLVLSRGDGILGKLWLCEAQSIWAGLQGILQDVRVQYVCKKKKKLLFSYFLMVLSKQKIPFSLTEQIQTCNTSLLLHLDLQSACSSNPASQSHGSPVPLQDSRHRQHWCECPLLYFTLGGWIRNSWFWGFSSLLWDYFASCYSVYHVCYGRNGSLLQEERHGMGSEKEFVTMWSSLSYDIVVCLICTRAPRS